MPSLAGAIGSSIWRNNPLLGAGLSFGVGAGAFAAVYTFINSDGPVRDRIEEGGQSGIRYTLGGTMATMAGLTLANVGGRALGRSAGSFIRNTPSNIASYGKSLAADYSKGGSFLSGISRVAERKPLMTGLGAVVGAVIGHAIDKDNPNKGAAVGAVVGAGAGLALSAGLRASRIWNKFGRVGKYGAIGLLSAAAYGASTIMSRPKYGQIDQADPENYGLQSRMDSMSATGDLVFGLHNSR